MKLKKIKLHNFLRYDNVELDNLHTNNLIAIVGRNGSGKSSLFEAITYSLFGKGRYSDKKLKNRYVDDEYMEVDITFLTETNKELRVIRGIKKQTSFAKVYFGGEEKANSYKGATSYIEKILNMNYKTFTTSVYCKQDGFDSFTGSDVTPSKRKQILSDILDLSLYSNVEERINNSIKVLDIEMQSFTMMITQVKNELQQLTSENIKDVKEQILERKNTLETNLLELESSLKSLREKKEKYLEETFKIKEYQNFKELYDKEKDELENLVSNSEKIREDIDNFQKDLLTMEKELSLINVPISIDYSSSQNLQSKKINIETELEKIEININLLLNQTSPKCPTCNTELQPDKKIKLIEKLENDKKELLSKKVEIESQLKKEEDRIEKLKKKIEEIEIRRQKLNNDITKLKTLIETKNKELIEKEEKIEILKKELVQKEIKLKNYENELAKIKSDIHINDLETKISDLERTQSSLLAEKENIITLLERMKIKEEKIKELKKKLHSFEYKLNNEYIKQMEVLKILKKIFSRDGIPTLIMNEALIEIEQYSNSLLSKLYPEYSIEFSTREYSQKDTIKDGLWIFVRDQIGKNDYEGFSGGEKDIINVAINLGIAFLIRNRSKSIFDIIILDEVFRHLDDMNAEKLLDFISYIQEDFSQIFVVNHGQFIKEIFPSKLFVYREGNFSRISKNS